ncbi:hypothetical protein ACFX2J_004796 [Malus domestica]
MEVTETPIQNNEDENDDVFFDALDGFPSTDESDQSTSPTTASLPDSKPSQATHLRRRPSLGAIADDDSKASYSEAVAKPRIDGGRGEVKRVQGSKE